MDRYLLHKKHSSNLIDVIEIGDFVNGRDDTCENSDIKTILTKEQYNTNCYKVGGEGG